MLFKKTLLTSALAIGLIIPSTITFNNDVAKAYNIEGNSIMPAKYRHTYYGHSGSYHAKYVLTKHHGYYYFRDSNKHHFGKPYVYRYERLNKNFFETLPFDGVYGIRISGNKIIVNIGDVMNGKLLTMHR